METSKTECVSSKDLMITNNISQCVKLSSMIPFADTVVLDWSTILEVTVVVNLSLCCF